jgi:hypothetical protein
MSTPLEQARALAQARNFLSELCVPGKIKRVPRAVRTEARRHLKHFPLSWDLPKIAADPEAMQHMRDTEQHYFDQFWKEIEL